MFRYLIWHALLSLGACSVQAQPAQVNLICHAEKSLEGKEFSLQNTSALLRVDISLAICAQLATKEAPSLRLAQTVQSLATTLQETDNQSFLCDDFASTMAENAEAYRRRIVLIGWDHKKTPKIAAALGLQDGADKSSGNSFGRTCLIDFNSSDALRLCNLCHRMMFGESDVTNAAAPRMAMRQPRQASEFSMVNLRSCERQEQCRRD